MKQFVVYLTFYKGNKLPKWYIGSSNENKILNGYNGSIKSKKWKEIYNLEQKENKHLFKTRILSKHNTRKDALKEELRLQKKHFVVKNKKYFNESYASINGMFGRDVSGENNPNFGKKWNSEQKEKASFNSKGKVRAIDLKTGQKIIIDKVLFENNDRYVGLTKGKCVLMNLKTGEKFHGSSDLIDGVNIVAESKGRKHKPKYFIEIYKDEKLLYALKDNIEEHCKQYNFSFRFILSRSRLGEIIKFGNNSAKERATKSGNIIFEGCRIIRVSIKD